MDIVWWAVIGVIVAIGWATMAIIGAIGWSRSKAGSSKTTAVTQENIATNRAVLEKLESIESRLGVVEKTLTDIQ